MSAQHTAGRLAVIHDTDIIGTENDPENGCVGTVDVAHVYLRTVPGRTEANARRLVACWNACEGISTESLESGQPMMAVFQKEQSRADRAEVGRDELLAALKSLMEMLDDEIKTSTDEQLAFGLSDPACPEHIKSELNCVIACRAAIAKAGGDA